ncbi:MAG: hypothetical protein JWN98_954, partial [Abditibacteriota bacterium]|nr:hypothetical protein [Abditibacteriota bacterium]
MNSSNRAHIDFVPIDLVPIRFLMSRTTLSSSRIHRLTNAIAWMLPAALVAPAACAATHAVPLARMQHENLRQWVLRGAPSIAKAIDTKATGTKVAAVKAAKTSGAKVSGAAKSGTKAKVVLPVSAALAAKSDQTLRFSRDIKPIFSENCYACHGPDPGSRKAGLRLDTEAGFFADRGEGPTVVKGKPLQSPLYQRITSKDDDELMPPKESHKHLKPAQIALIRRWIEQGAPWQGHWSFLKPERPALPAVKNAKWSKTPIDRFVLARLEKAGLPPAPDAPRHVLARRVALDLTGLPPEPKVLQAFLNDKSPNAYEKLVDQLIASPRYGEHRARYWLDAARYADTHGLHFDNYR